MTSSGQRPIETDCVIAGAGLSGLTAALALASSGQGVLIVDRDRPQARPGPLRDGRTTAIAAGGRVMLETLGLWAALSDEAEPILDIRVSDGVSRCFLHYDHRDVGDVPMGHIVENASLIARLSDAVAAAAGVVHLSGAMVESFRVGGGEIAVHLDDGRTVLARLLIGADGRNGRIRRQSGIRATRREYGQTSMVFCVTHSCQHHGVAHERFLPGGPLAFLPMPGNRSSVIWTERTPVAGALMALEDRAFAMALAQRFGDSLGHLEISGQRWSYPLSLNHAEVQTAPRTVIIGDAAHGLHPIAGQGFNLGLRDIATLADEVAAAGRYGLDIGSAEVLRRFQAYRTVDSMSLVLATDGLNRLFSNEIGAFRAARSIGLGVVNRIPPLKRGLMRHAMGLAGDLPRLSRGLMP